MQETRSAYFIKTPANCKYISFTYRTRYSGGTLVEKSNGIEVCIQCHTWPMKIILFTINF